MGSGTQHEHSGLPGEEGEKAPSLGKGMETSCSLHVQSEEDTDGVDL